MLMMRLQRVGRKNDPSFRIVVVDKRTGPKSNKNIDILGSYNPRLKHIQIDAEKAKSWLKEGVQPSGTVHNILVGQKVIDAKKINVLPRKSPIVAKETESEKKQKKEEEVVANKESEDPALSKGDEVIGDEKIVKTESTDNSNKSESAGQKTPVDENASKEADEAVLETTEEVKEDEDVGDTPETEEISNEDTENKKSEAAA